MGKRYNLYSTNDVLEAVNFYVDLTKLFEDVKLEKFEETYVITYRKEVF